jgi:hypothetical protein
MSRVIEVEMHAFAGGKIRKVTVPSIPEPATLTVDQNLNAVFQYGQNDFACAEDVAQRIPSVSVGDIVRLPFALAPDGAYARLVGQEYRRFVVLPIGFQEVPADFEPPAGDRGGFYAYELARRLE